MTSDLHPSMLADAAPAAATQDDRAVAGPVAQTERLSSLDTLRGVAVLGILLMNVVGFGLPSAAEEDPTLAGGAGGANLAFWFASQVLFEGKMRAVFSMLFGASVILLTTRLEGRAGSGAADIYYRRTLWLIGLGVLHGLFLWDGDILYTYGTAGLVLYPLRRLAPATLLIGGLLVLAVVPAKALLEASAIRSLRDQAAAAQAAQAAGETLSAEQEDAEEKWADKQKELRPSQAEIDKEVAVHRAGYGRLFLRRLRAMAGARSSAVGGTDFFDAAGMMLLGMGLAKLGAFAAARSRRFYVALMVLGYGVGVPLNTYVGLRVIAEDFDPVRTLLVRQAPYDAGRLAVALGHVGLVMLLCKADRPAWLLRRLACVGRMALTNYLLQSVICTLIFDGYGLGLFGRLDRAALLAVVVGVWALELAISPPWLRHFRFGPVEWAWRSLTYWRCQPMRQGKEQAAGATADGLATGPIGG
jgi:uncharacterized protein